jgi:putative PIN family toxin of toxin-antitoxin system
MKNKTVFDVNIWLRYFISGKSEKIIDMIENNNVFFCRSAELMLELKEVINRPKFAKYFPNGTKEHVLFVEQVSELFHTQPLFDQCPDPKDNYLFDLAYQSHSNFLVSDDKKVLATPVKQSLKSRSLSEFKAEIGITE